MIMKLDDSPGGVSPRKQEFGTRGVVRALDLREELRAVAISERKVCESDSFRWS